METKECSSRHPRIARHVWLRMRDLVAIQTGVMVLFSGLLYVFLDSEIEAHLASAHTTLRSTGTMLAPVLLTLTAFTWVLSSLLLGGYAWLEGRRQNRSLAIDHLGIGECPGREPSNDVDPKGVEGASGTIPESVRIHRALREDLKALRQARDAGDKQTVEKHLRRMEQLLDRTSD